MVFFFLNISAFQIYFFFLFLFTAQGKRSITFHETTQIFLKIEITMGNQIQGIAVPAERHTLLGTMEDHLKR